MYYEDLNDKTLKEFAMLNYAQRYKKEQLFDFLNNARFRNSIITHATNKIETDAEKMLENIRDFHLAFIADLQKIQSIKKKGKRHD